MLWYLGRREAYIRRWYAPLGYCRGGIVAVDCFTDRDDLGLRWIDVTR